MPHNDIIHASIKTAEDMGFVGNAFGTKFLRPLIESPDPNINSLVLALYGAQTVGKTPFAEGAALSFPDFFDAVANKPKFRNMIQIVKPDRLFRWEDFEYEAGDHQWNWFPSPLEICPLVTRPVFSERNGRKAGVDILEHAPMHHLNNAHVVALFGKSSSEEHANGYFAKAAFAGSFCPEIVEKSCSNPKAKKIAEEMRHMRNVVLTELHPARLTEERYVTLILTTENKQASRAFKRFKNSVAAYLC
jgi:hypothetical protein